MSSLGLEWYKREPVAYLRDVQGLSSKEHAVYSVVIDLLYVHGGVIQNDPKFISGFISDIGSASVRNILASLAANKRITLEVTKDEISQKRAKNEVKTKVKQRENAVKTGRIGGVLSAELRASAKENNDLDQGYPSNQIQPEKRREEKSSIKLTTVSCPNDDLTPPNGGDVSLFKSEFKKVWAAYPRKVKKQSALKAFIKARKKHDYNYICKPLRIFIDAMEAEGDVSNMAHLSTYLNEERFDPDEDQLAAVTGRTSKGTHNGKRQADNGNLSEWIDRAESFNLDPPPDGT